MSSPTDRVRRYVGDESAPYRFTGERVAEALSEQEENARGEILAAIDLLEFAPSRGTLTSIKQGSTSRTFGTSGLTDADRLKKLRDKLAAFDLPVGSSGLVAVVEIETPMADAYRSPLLPGCGLDHFGL